MLENKGHMGLRIRYSDEYVARALELVQSLGSVTKAARELRVSRSMLYRWIDNAKQGPPSAGVAAAAATPADGGGSPATPPTGARRNPSRADSDRAEVLRLRKEVESLNLDIDILKKAALILGSPAHSKHAG
jgi:transposase-like protein